MKARKADAEPEKPEPFEMKKFPPMTAAAYRRAERAGQMSLPEVGDTPPRCEERKARC